MCYDVHYYFILEFYFYILVTPKPEDVDLVYGQPKFCFKYRTLYQPCGT